MIRLLGIDYQIPKIDLLIYSTAEMFDGAVVANSNTLEIDEVRVERRLFEGDIDQERDLDYFIDIALLQRDGYSRLLPSMIAGHTPTVEIRSAYTFQDTRQVSPIAPIAYPMTEGSADCLKFFLNNIFRKNAFREKQIDILGRALALQPVIGLLPTGSGKSLCYQLSALLQPGMTVIIDPIISLMIDQSDNLRDKFAIDWHETISSQKDTGEKIEVMQAMTEGKLKWIFLSPERLQSRRISPSVTDVFVLDSRYLTASLMKRTVFPSGGTTSVPRILGLRIPFEKMAIAKAMSQSSLH